MKAKIAQNNSQVSEGRITVKPGHILGDPGADSGDEGKSKRVEKFGAKKSKERREEPVGTLVLENLCFSAQSEASRPMGRFVYPYTE